MTFREAMFTRVPSGYDVRLSEDERSLLRSVPAGVERVLTRVGDVSEAVPSEYRRLFPIAFATDEQAETEYERTTRRAIAEHHRAALDLMMKTSSAERLTDEQMGQWLEALNTLRLVFGTLLDVSEESFEPDDDDPQYAEWMLYRYLTYLEAEAVDALSEALPPPAPGADDTIPDDPWGNPPGDLRWDGTPTPRP
jgi:hypothetical protein